MTNCLHPGSVPLDCPRKVHLPTVIAPTEVYCSQRPRILESSAINSRIDRFTKPLLYLQNDPMSNDAEETGLSLIFGIVGILIAFTALLIAYLQLRRMRTERIQVVYELA
jgi:hypothetical protein